MPRAGGPLAFAASSARKLLVALRHWLILAMTVGLGPIRLRRLLEATGSPEAAVEAPAALLGQLDGIGTKTAGDIASGLRDAKSHADEEIERAATLGVSLISVEDDGYPALLKQIVDPPPVLWVWGELQPRDLNAMAVVGSRRPSGYGKEQATRFGELLATAGFTLVSGGAYGIDSCAHRGALRATDGRTIAVLGCGVDIPYPPEHRDLFAEISEGRGAVISEHALGLPPRKENFPRRNRIISGISRGLLVVEADEKSGALITAREAVEQSRQVFAVPGRIDNPMSAGPHQLLRTGASLAANLDDIIENLGPLSHALHEPAAVADEADSIPSDLFSAKRASAGTATGSASAVAASAVAATLSEADTRVLEAVDNGPLAVDAIIDASALPASTVQASLMMLGIKGFLRRGSDGRYERKR